MSSLLCCPTSNATSTTAATTATQSYDCDIRERGENARPILCSTGKRSMKRKRTTTRHSSISSRCLQLLTVVICRVSPFVMIFLVDALAFPLFPLHPPSQRRRSSRNNTPRLHSFISTRQETRHRAFSAADALASSKNKENEDSFALSSSSSLEQCTVLELRQRVRDTHPPRGVVSQLQRKQDLLEYLQSVLALQQQQPQEKQFKEQSEVTTKATTTATRIIPTNKRTSVPLQMPPKPAVSKNKSHKNANGYESPKDLLFEKVMQRYPTAHLNNNNNIIINNNSPDDEEDDDDDSDIPTSPFSPVVDVRQEYHPVMQSFSRQWQSTDLDLILVGTASCMPSLTRGVSCTALRFNWKQRTTQLPNAKFVSQPQQPQKQQQPNQQQPFGGGIWLFDVGECTQVSNCHKRNAFFFICLCMLLFVVVCKGERGVQRKKLQDAGTRLTISNEDDHLLKVIRDIGCTHHSY